MLRSSLGLLLGCLPLPTQTPAQAPLHEYPAADSLAPAKEVRADAQQLLTQLLWQPARFKVRQFPASQKSVGHAELRFPSPRPWNDQDKEVVLEWYQARRKRSEPETVKRPAVLLLHIINGNMWVARNLARNLARHQVHALVMHLPGYGRRKRGGEGVANLIPRAQQGVGDARRARDAIAALPGIDAARISLQGTSLGGFIACSTAALDDGFAHNFLLLAGGDLPQMFKHGSRTTARVRHQLIRAGYEGDKLNALLRRIDPLRLAHRVRADKTFLYSAKEDQVVPPANARALGKGLRLAETQHIWIPGNHYTSVFAIPEVVKHMVRQLRRPQNGG